MPPTVIPVRSSRRSLGDAVATKIRRIFVDGGAVYRLKDAKGLGTVFFEDSGKSAANTKLVVLCLPGIGDTRRQYRFLGPLLRDRLRCRVFVGDLRGIGDSTSFQADPDEDCPTYSPDALAVDVLHLMHEVAFSCPDTQFVLIGNSLSAGTMVLAAAMALGAPPGMPNPLKIAAVTMLGPIVRDTSADRWFRPLSRVLFTTWWGASMWIKYYKTLFPGKRPPDFETEVADLAIHLSSDKQIVVNIGRYVRASKRNVEQAVYQLGAHSSVPVLAVLGKKDPDYANVDTEAAWLQRCIPHVHVVLEEQGGHYPHLERPERVVEELMRLLPELAESET